MKTEHAQSYDEAMAKHGHRLTEQRRQVYEVLLERRDHPTAVEVFMRVKERIPSVSLATIYNCLETLTDCGLVRHVGTEKGPARFCPNLEEHAHFFCDKCGCVLDVAVADSAAARGGWHLPKNAVVTRFETAFHGLCPDCSKPTSTLKRTSLSKTLTINNL